MLVTNTIIISTYPLKSDRNNKYKSNSCQSGIKKGKAKDT